MVVELILPRRCAGCGEGGHDLCPRCRRVLSQPPFRVSVTNHPHVPVFAFGPYADVHRGIVLSMKERRNMAVRKHIGAVLEAGLRHLAARGEIVDCATLVPAPTRATSARARGGDPVAAVCRASGHRVWEGLRLHPRTGDQAALSAQERRTNLAGGVRIVRGAAVPEGPLIVVDDVVTTGATLQVSVEKLLAHGGDAVACVALCAA